MSSLLYKGPLIPTCIEASSRNKFSSRAREENLFLDDASMHVGIRGPLYSRDDIKNDESFGFKIIHCDEFQTEGTDKIAERIKKRVGDNALYLSIDIDA